jgi:arylsulfatase
MDDRPDFVLIMTDQQRFDQVGYQSNGFYETPNIDRFAQRGVVFENAYSGSTTCAPARMSLLTGLQNHRVPTQINRFALREGFWTIARALRHVGYETALIGKMHFAPVHAQHGFDTMRLCEHLRPRDLRLDPEGRPREVDDYHEWLLANGLTDWRASAPPDSHGRGSRDPNGEKRWRPTSATPFPYDAAVHPTGWIEGEALSFLERRDRSRPLLLVISFPHPHAPYNAPEPYASMFDPTEVRLPADGFEVNDCLSMPFLVAMATNRGRFGLIRLEGNEDGARVAMTQVRALVKQIDDAIGRIIERIDLTRTVVFFTSDHGDFAGHRGLLGKVPWMPFDDLARVPLVAVGRGVAGGRRAPELVQNCDFPLTTLDYAGVEVPSALFDTRSVRPLLEGRRRPEDQDRAVMCATTMGWPMIRRGRFKYIRPLVARPGVLFDLERDPGETVDLLEDPSCESVATELSSRLDQELARGVPSLPAV